MSQDREAILARMKEILPRGEYFDLGYFEEKDDSFFMNKLDALTGPFVSGNIQGPPFPISGEDLDVIIEWLQLAREIYPDELTIAHARQEFCGNPVCTVCYERERRSSSYFGYLWDQVGDKPLTGQVVLYHVGGGYRMFSAGKPQARLRAIERELSEPVTFVHGIQTNDHMYLKTLWHIALGDYYAGASKGFELPSNVVALFKSRREQVFDREQPNQEIMGEAWLYEPQNLLGIMRRYLDQGYCISRKSMERLVAAEKGKA